MTKFFGNPPPAPHEATVRGSPSMTSKLEDTPTTGSRLEGGINMLCQHYLLQIINGFRVYYSIRVKVRLMLQMDKL